MCVDMNNADAAMLEKRFELLECLLLWEGRLNRGRLMELFGLSPNRASVAIRLFREQHPDWLKWDSKARSFHATWAAYRDVREQGKGHHGLGDTASLSRYLTFTGLPYVSAGASSEEAGGVLEAFPDLSSPNPQHFAALLGAIRDKEAVEITYRSMKEPKPHQRTVSPHSLIRAGRRWHVRAYCSMKNGFRDYSLGRIVEAKRLNMPSARGEQDDEAWMTQVQVRLIGHPDLTPEQEDLIRFEYFGNTSARVQTCRGALVSYFIQDVRAATDVKTQRPPDYQLAVGNLKEVKSWLFPG